MLQSGREIGFFHIHSIRMVEPVRNTLGFAEVFLRKFSSFGLIARINFQDALANLFFAAIVPDHLFQEFHDVLRHGLFHRADFWLFACTRGWDVIAGKGLKLARKSVCHCSAQKVRTAKSHGQGKRGKLSGAAPVVRPLDAKRKNRIPNLEKIVVITHTTLHSGMQLPGAFQ
jgi:hypothetical protein